MVLASCPLSCFSRRRLNTCLLELFDRLLPTPNQLPDQLISRSLSRVVSANALRRGNTVCRRFITASAVAR